MKIRVIKIGKPADKAYTQLAEKFEKRLKGFCKFEHLVLKAHDGVEKSKRELFSKLELDASGRPTNPAHKIVSLDERGKIFSSPDLAKFVESSINNSQIKCLSIVIGGPYGIPAELRTESHQIWSLSHAVFPSDMAWVMVWEQLYRASAIIRGTSYHHV